MLSLGSTAGLARRPIRGRGCREAARHQPFFRPPERAAPLSDGGVFLDSEAARWALQSFIDDAPYSLMRAYCMFDYLSSLVSLSLTSSYSYCILLSSILQNTESMNEYRHMKQDPHFSSIKQQHTMSHLHLL